MVLIFVLSSIWSFAEGGVVEISPLNSPADLDLSGDIVYAINFGNNGNPNVGGIVFSEDQEHSTITLDVEGEGPATWWGPYPGTGDSELDQLMNGLAYRSGTAPIQISINAGGLIVGRPYLLQLIGYEPENHSRNVDIIVENEEIVTGLNPIIQQGGVVGQGGFVIKYEFIAGDPILNIRILSHINACAMSGLILTEIAEQATVFTDCGSGTTIELAVGKGIWQLNWGQGPWTWSEVVGLPLLDSNVSGILDIHSTAPADVSADLFATLPIAGTLTLSAHDEKYRDVTIGTMVLSGVGINVIDINASRVIVDEGSGMFFAPFHPPGPKVTLTLDEATGVFAYIDQVGNWELSIAGSYAVPLIPGIELQDNIFTALGGNVPLIGGIGEFALTGQYVPDMSRKVKSFCEYGMGVALQLGAGGALWDHTWGKGAYEWYQCDADPDEGILNENVVGVLETTTAGAPQIDENFILSFDFGGNFTLTEQSSDNSDEIAGQILGDVEGTFVADMNAVNAVVDEAAGTITIVFGAELHDNPDALITVTETTGTFKDIRPIGLWEWYVFGKIVCARVPDLSVQDNIMAALGNDELLLGAEEEIVLSGSYYVDSPEE